MTSRAYVIGNGQSRKNLDLSTLKNGPTFGCNALYRDFQPDWLVAIDNPIIEEIEASDFPKERFIVPPPDEQHEPAEYNQSRPRSNAGMNAMVEAIKRGHRDLVMVGFDAMIAADDVAMSNLYHDTNAYGDDTRASLPDTRARLSYLSWFMNATGHLNMKYTFAFPTGTSTFVLPNNNATVVSYESTAWQYIINPKPKTDEVADANVHFS